MDPGRQAMINNWKGRDRDVTSPRHDPNNRIGKPSRRPPQSKPGAAASAAAANANKYLSQDEQSAKFVADEDKFVLKQAKKKADIRVRENRAEPIDLLAFNLRYVETDRDIFDDDDADVDIDVPAPDLVLEGLDEEGLKKLAGDIKSYATLEVSDMNTDYWRSLQTLCDSRRGKLAGQGPEGRAVGSVASDVDKILAPKTYEQLEALEKQIKGKLSSDEPIDTDYWEALLKSLLVWKAKAKLTRIYESMKKARIELLRERDPEKARELESSVNGGGPFLKNSQVSSSKTEAKPALTSSAAPSSSSSAAPPPGTARFATTDNEDFSQATKALYEREVARGIEDGEEIFQAEEVIPSSAKPQWADKYRPRKPRYFNRVQMGYEWNKYNQTHYDHDNPPPKVVHGYKFNIFYPDLIDKTKAPTYKIIREGGRRRGESFAAAGEDDTCLIKFVAGPPYQDIAFRIVDREWDYSAKKERGFKSTFDKGILQLHFQFKKIFYRK